MSDKPRTTAADKNLNRRQGLTVFRMELRRIFFGPGFFALLLLAALPIFPFALRLVVSLLFPAERAVADTTTVFAAVFQGFILPMVLFFGCVMIFTGLIRREVRERTLHHLFLAPVPRRTILLGKYAAGVFAGTLVFATSTLVAFALAYAPHLFAPGSSEGGIDGQSFALRTLFLAGPGFGHLLRYLLVIALGTIGYGAVFLLFAMFVKNPIVPMFGVLAWESINAILPVALKKISVYHYLHGLCPVPVVDLPFAILAQAPSPWVAIPGLLALAAVLLWISTLKFDRMEIQYGGE
ncbi:MAG: ABC transporter permease [Acidobacteriota bacterium]